MKLDIICCPICGKEFKKKKQTQKYCSAECQRNALKIDRGTAVCKYCGKEFNCTRERSNIFCSRFCSSKYYGEIRTRQANERKEADRLKRKAARERKAKAKHDTYIQEHTKACLICGKTFVARNAKRECCSIECSKKRENNRRDKRLYRNGKPDLSVSLSKLYDRDKGICKRCGAMCDWKDVEVRVDGVIIAGATYPSIDHIKPIAKGGLHEWGNVQLLCRHCNTLKRDK